MATIKVRVGGEIATNLTPEVRLVCQNDKYDVEFEFDESWANSNFKTALFIYNGKSIAVPFDREQNGNVCKIPALYETELLHIGVKSSDIDGLHTSTPARVGCLLSANDIANGEIPNPTPSQYDEIIALLNQYLTGGGSGEPIDLRDYQKKVDDGLETTDKTIVGAINEVNAKASKPSGGGLTEEEVKEIVQETLPDWVELEEKPTYAYEEIKDKPTLVEGIDASVDEQTLSLTIDLKDKDGNVISTKTIELPISDPDLSEYVKFTDIGKGLTLNKNKVEIYTHNSYGLNLSGSGVLMVLRATDDEVEAKTNTFKPITPASVAHAVKVGITTNTNELTDEEKASACEWLGALEKSPLPRKLYGTNNENEQKMWGVATSASISTNGNIPQYHLQTSGVGNESNIPRGVLVTNTPKNSYHCATKDYVDNLPDNVTDETIKAKWRAWLGI